MIPICKLCLKHKKLIKAHIIPESFFGTDNFLITNESKYPKRRPIGIYDNTILCRDCDNVVGSKFDDYAKTVLIDGAGVSCEIIVDKNSGETITVSRLKDKEGYVRLTKFFISVLWRASIASCDEFKSFNLGPFENIARDIIISGKENNLNYFSVAICRFHNFNEKIQVMSPKLLRLEHINFYAFVMANMKVFVKCDKRNTPKKLRPITLSKQNHILMLDSDLKSFPEYKILVEMALKFQQIKGKRKYGHAP